MITIKTAEEIEKLREGGRKLAAILDILKKEAMPGVTALSLDKLAEKLILEVEGHPAFKGYKGSRDQSPFPGTVCISVNDEVVHSPPSNRKLKNGDIVGLDIGMKYKNLFTDMAETIGIGEISDSDNKLIKVTKEALDLAISIVHQGVKTGDIGEAVQNFIEANSFGVVRRLVGHGVGYQVHEDPQIPNWGRSGEGTTLKENMVIAIEPMVTEGNYELYLAEDGWTWKTKDGSRSAHFEHTIVVTKNGAEVLTRE
ncbi:type I methionyl aminopeptidase [Candidatus Giovannonibacteria bacterium RIFCSPLOWO2_02_FULL_43_11b]|uniref:Methionine aminopeptidase n=1 Tax=Candidatus Giovannonibacteria bacterium RIFCSPHIGHO2_12_FULL_43_15 TaxID=1798341 RepID=A0A1F5WR32_9BACT|nr:MAG: type I methionyl aminopeptidase [Candidatus Giovannonibacteria bacterium RIFCSPHIGHO2_01_FULL_43_100]OGF66951.1 MAG: type I methionyl aminopeptidase [Candidatus Giovannonibacteria bacterium RIFCSPHIGHO2_02_FULL_43_32]OGF78132.1 MAG: type I methionyl aminopeptidase [Candidatus Giovannonibacteria bacterium RIFCSPHIGHO2_12_FULL_43_15]OGF78539.1 MAG: type I methionyl aminopeptidase [Candidatus Giovannonibacteria bacterium RIFCSPLOWO2_01_FULL_43_60]OGF89880.1 MAG: type I methionyl aminopepti